MFSPSGDAPLIVGGSGVGKSTLSRYCVTRWPAKCYVDLGTIREVLQAQHPEFELSTYVAWRLAGDVPTFENLIKGFETYAALLWPSVLRVFHSTAREQKNVVVEGAMMSLQIVSEARIECHARGIPIIENKSFEETQAALLSMALSPD